MEKRIPCEYCGVLGAVLYCQPDSAKLCLFCDRIVHSANALSRKHIRSQICGSCCRKPGTSRCVMDGLVLCQDCDRDVHGGSSGSALHDRVSIHAFSGCPSPVELASLLGFDFSDDNSRAPAECAEQDTVFAVDAASGCQVLNTEASGAAIVRPSARRDAACGKQNQLISQLLQMAEQGQVCGLGAEPQLTGFDHSPGALVTNSQQNNSIPVASDGRDEESLSMQKIPFTSLLMFAGKMNFADDYGFCKDGHWEADNVDPSAQGWDFTLDKQNVYDGSSAPAINYDVNDANCMPRNYVDLETSFNSTNILEAMCDINGCSVHADPSLPNLQHNSSHHMRIATSSSNSQMTASPLIQDLLEYGTNFPLAGASRCNSWSSIGEPSFLLGSEMSKFPVTTGTDVLTQNRGNAMLRYKEKRRTRRYDKHVRYESRKARADARKRVKGRFVKST